MTKMINDSYVWTEDDPGPPIRSEAYYKLQEENERYRKALEKIQYKLTFPDGEVERAIKALVDEALGEKV